MLDAKTGGTINMESSGPNNFNIGDSATFNVQSLADSYPLMDGSFSGGRFTIEKNANVKFQTNKTMFSGVGGSIYLNGTGLPIKTSTNTDGSGAVTDVAARGFINTKISLWSLTPDYSSKTIDTLKNAKYIEFGNATPVVSFGSTLLNRFFKLSSSDLPRSGLSALIPGQDNMNFTVNSNKEDPNVVVKASITSQKHPDTFTYSWKDNSGNVQTLSSSPKVIWSQKDGKYTMNEDSSGYNYVSNYDQNHGLLLQTTNLLKNGTYDDATINYTLEDGPSSED